MWHVILTNDIRAALIQMKRRSYVINKKTRTARLYGQEKDTIKLVHIARLDQLNGIQIKSYERLEFRYGSLILDAHEIQVWDQAVRTCEAAVAG